MHDVEFSVKFFSGTRSSKLVRNYCVISLLFFDHHRRIVTEPDFQLKCIYTFFGKNCLKLDLIYLMRIEQWYRSYSVYSLLKKVHLKTFRPTRLILSVQESDHIDFEFFLKLEPRSEIFDWLACRFIWDYN